VSLEPCSRQGRTPPCVDALVAAGIARVVCATTDPTQAGLERLRAAGIAVDALPADDALALAARRQNAPFRTWSVQGRPHVRYKAALTFDGRTATRSGDSRWITSAVSRRLVHDWRAEAGAVMVGIGTALADDPELTPRDADPPAERLPTRVVVDRGARLPLDSRLVRDAGEADVLVLTAAGAPPDRCAALASRGVEVVTVEGLDRPGPDGLRACLAVLADRRITDVLLEGGATLAAAMLDADVVDRVLAFVAPVLLADPAAPGMLGHTAEPPLRMDAAPRLASLTARAVGPDILLDGWVRDPP
jgi:diaminohydroxyphosphoribosylaminopyrimidine deaminase/5-amino-6-(5-phosphoribosylamino)uracil reductase